MSRVAQSPIKLPSGVDLSIKGSQLNVKGPKGNLSLDLYPGISFDENKGEYLVKNEDEKNKQISKLNQQFRKYKHSHIVIIQGDLNARIQTAISDAEMRHIGKHAFDKDNIDIWDKGEDIWWNRNAIVNRCKEHDLIIHNTLFYKKQ